MHIITSHSTFNIFCVGDGGLSGGGGDGFLFRSTVHSATLLSLHGRGVLCMAFHHMHGDRYTDLSLRR